MTLDLGTLKASAELDLSRWRTGVQQVTADFRSIAAAGQSVRPVQLDTSPASRAVQALGGDLRDLIAAPAELQVGADTGLARRAVQALAGEVRGLPDGEVQVDADVSRAERAVDGLSGDIRAGLGDAGETGGADLADRVIGALESIPVAGAIVGVGAAIGGALGAAVIDGLQDEVTRDLFSARTGLDEDTSRRFARAAGEAYAQAWGESVDQNLDVARLAVQRGLLDEAASVDVASGLIGQLQGVATIMEEDVGRVVRTVGSLLKNDFAGNADEALDILVAGQQAGANTAEDLLDTLDEYPAVLRRLGLDGRDSLLLISQGLDAGARDSDFLADALKELQIRVTDGTAAEALKALGLGADDLAGRFAVGGARAREGLDLILDSLRDVEDPLLRSQLAVGVFGVKAEDLGDALLALDLDGTARGLDDIDGAANRALTALADNEATSVQEAWRSILLVVDEVKAGLAEAFGPAITQAADSISGNRQKVLVFLTEIANGAFDGARALVEMSATGVEALGGLVTGAGPVLDTLADITYAAGLVAAAGGNLLLARELRDASTSLRGTATDMAAFEAATADAADTLRDRLIAQGLDPAQARMNDFLDPAVARAGIADTLAGVTAAIDDVGTASGSTRQQVQDAAGAIEAYAVAAGQVGEGSGEVETRVLAARDALVEQVVALGRTREEAEALVDTYLSVPDTVSTAVSTPGGRPAQDRLTEVDRAARRIPGNRSTSVSAPGARGSRDALAGVDTAARRIPGSRNTRLSTSGARTATREASVFQQVLASIPTFVGVNLAVQGAGALRRRLGLNTGGRVTGPDGVDVIPAMLTNGEYVLDRGDVQRLGGSDRIDELRASLERSPGPQRFNTGGRVGASAAVPVAAGVAPSAVVVAGDDSRAAALVVELVRTGSVRLDARIGGIR